MQAYAIIVLLVSCYILKRFIDYIINKRKVMNVLDKFPHTPRHWFWGHLHEYPGLNEEGLEYFRNLVVRFPRCFSFWAGNYVRGYLYLSHPETISVILKTTEPKQIDSGPYKILKGWLGNGLVVSSGDVWFRNRRLLTNVFHFEILKHYLVCKNQCTDIFLNKLSQFAKTGKSIDMFENVAFLTLDILLRCCFSYESNVQLNRDHNLFLKALSSLEDGIGNRLLKPWLQSDFIYGFTNEHREFRKNADYVHKVSDNLISERRKLHKSSSENRQKDFLDILLQAGDEDGIGLTDSEIRDEVDTFLFAGHDTSTSAISWIFYSLAEHPEIQKQCQNEVDEIFKNKIDDELKWDDLPKLKYLTMCIKEALRLHTPVFWVARQLEHAMMIDGIDLPPGILIVIDIYSLHHNPLVWSDPMKYDPNRFSPENIDKIDCYSFVPFSAGPRNCIGQNFAMEELKLVVAKTLRRFTLQLVPDHQTKHKPSIVMKTEDGMFMKLIERP